MEINKEYLVTIGLPVYNGQDFLEDAIRSILNQDYKNIELIISDNCSIDDTSIIVEKYLLTDSRIKYFRHKVNNGPNFNFRFSLMQAKGDYFMWVSHDDIISKNWVSTLIGDVDPSFSTAHFGTTSYMNECGEIINSPANNILFNFSGSSLMRRLNFIFTPHLFGKMILLYALFPTKILKEFALEDLNCPGFINQDLYLVFKSLNYLKYRSNRGCILYKRNHQNSESIKHKLYAGKHSGLNAPMIHKAREVLSPFRPIVLPLFYFGYWARLSRWEKNVLIFSTLYLYPGYIIKSLFYYIQYKRTQ